MFRPFILILTLAAGGCSKDPAVWQISNLTENRILVFGHGGMGEKDLKPMDSGPSLLQCLEVGADGVEMDVRMTADGKLVLFHDDEMDRMTGCSGKVRDKSWKEISECAYTPELVTGEKVILLSEFLSRVPDRKAHLFTLECKLLLEDDSAYVRNFAAALAAITTEFMISPLAFVESYNGYFLREVLRKDPALRVFLYTEHHLTGIGALSQTPLYGITMANERITAEQVAEAHKAGLRVSLFNVTGQRTAIDAIKKSPDFVQTDDIHEMLSLLN